MKKEYQIELAKKFRALHKGKMLLLPNAWNGGSAKVFEKEGFSAIGTTSAGIAYSLGYADGEKIAFSDLLRVTKEITRVVHIPLTVDLERGYSEDLGNIEQNITEIISLGAVGINIEDGLPEHKNVDPISDFIKKIESITRLREELGIPFFINARTDIYLFNIGTADEMLQMTIKRAEALQKAGADSIFIPGALDEETISTLRSNISMPINLFVHNEFNEVNKLNEIGINRLSSGSSPVRSCFDLLINISKDFNSGECNSMLANDFSHPVANNYFKED